MALEWQDVDLEASNITVKRSDWKGHVTTPKGGRERLVPMPNQLWDALRRHQHLRDATTSEPMIPMSEIEDARQSLEIKLQRIRESWDCVETGQ